MQCKRCGNPLKLDFKEQVDKYTGEILFEISGSCDLCHSLHEHWVNWREIHWRPDRANLI